MKLQIITILLVVFLIAVPLVAQTSPEGLVREVLGGLSSDFAEKNPKIAFRPTIAVLNIEETSDDAKKHRVADALYPLLENLLHRSTVFELVERKNLAAVIKEQELTLTGLTTDGKVSLGGLKEAEYLVKGSISELGEDLQLSLALVSVQDGTIGASRSGRIPKSVLIASADAFSAKYVSQYGIGIELKLVPETYFQLNSQEVTNGVALGLDLNYRLSKDFLFNFGAETLFTTRALVSTLQKQPGQQQQPLLQTQSISSNSFVNPEQLSVDYNDSRNLTSIFLGGAWVINASRELNFNLGANLRLSFMTQTQTYDITGSATYNGTPYYPAGDKPAPVDISASSAALYAEPFLKVQWYLNPRLTLNLGYSLNLKVAELTSHVYYVYADQRYTSESGRPIQLTGYAIKPWVDPFSGQNMTYDFSAQRIFISLGFYF